jgi:hypothetical protein
MTVMADEGFGSRAAVDPSDEALPFLSNFQDVFLSIGVLALLGGIVVAGTTSAVNLADMLPLSLLAGSVAVVVLAATWGLSELLVRARRRVLPGIVLCLAFLGAALTLFFSVYAEVLSAVEMSWDTVWSAFDQVDIGAGDEMSALRAASRDAVAATPWPIRFMPLALSLAGLFGSLVYYRRFRLPFASAMVGSGLIAVATSVLLVVAPFDFFRFNPLVQLLSGLALLAGGIAFDARDPERVTRFSGNGFWLHFFAAPIVLSGALTMVSVGPAYDASDFDTDALMGQFSAAQSAVTLLVIALFAVVSLLLNRRALVVSGLVSAGVAIGVIVSTLGMGGAGIAATTLILLGGGVILLGIGWNAARRGLLRFVPEAGPWGRLFPRVTADG